MKRRFIQLLAFVCCLCLTSSASMAQVPAQTPQQTPASPAASLSTPDKPILEDGTPVKLRINQTISSADAKEGQRVDFEVLEEIRVSGLLVIPKGGIAWATVTEAQPKRRMGRAGKLDINIDSVRLVDGEKVALRAVKEVKGGGHQGAMTGAIVATSLVVWPAAPLFLLMHGKDITIPKGTEITAFINGNAPLDAAKFQLPSQAQSVATAGAATNVKPTEADVKVEVSSTPDGADVLVDGNFVGNTPSSVGVLPGDHVITVKKVGYKAWERKVAISSGHVKLAPELESERNTVKASTRAEHQ